MLGRPRYLRMLVEVRRFHRHARAVLRDPAADGLTLAGFLRQGGYSRYFADHFMLPLTGAVWSSSPATIRDFPARYLIRFFANHGMLTVKNSPQWRTVTGGSREYVARIAAGPRRPRPRRHTPVVSIERDERGVTVNGDHRFDRVVIAAHPDQALRDAGRPVGRRARRCSAGSPTPATRPCCTPTRRSCRAPPAPAPRGTTCSTPAPRASRHVHVTYHLNRLQALHEPVDYCVTLNGTTRIGAGHELRRMTYEHPIYTHASLAAQTLLPRLQGDRNTYYCGAYHGWGFHEDGCVSGLRAALALGCAW